jgi:hypothetical protein
MMFIHKTLRRRQAPDKSAKGLTKRNDVPSVIAKPAGSPKPKPASLHSSTLFAEITKASMLRSRVWTKYCQSLSTRRLGCAGAWVGMREVAYLEAKWGDAYRLRIWPNR